MNQVFFDLGVFLYWSEDSMTSKSLTSKGSLIVSNKDELKTLKDIYAVMDPDIVEMLYALREAGFSLYVCDIIPVAQTRESVKKLGIAEYFDGFVSGKTEQTLARGLNQKCKKDDFGVFVGTEEKIMKAATKLGMPSVAYGKNWSKAGKTAFSVALSPLEVEDQVNIALLIHDIVQKTIQNESRILGIDGIAFAGKKVLAEKISRYMDLVGQENMTVDLEDFHRAVEESYKGEDPVESYYFNGYNNEKLIEEVLDPYIKDGRIDKKVYCLDTSNDAFINERHYKLSENGVMILVGTMMYREPLIRYFDTTIYVRVDYREAEHRASLMEAPIYGDDPLEVYIEKNIPAQKMYVARHDPFDKRDFVIDNTNYHRPFFID